MATGTKGRWLRRLGLGLAGLLVLAAAGFVVWAANPLGPGERALAALRSDGTVRVTERQGWYVFEPARADTTGPGAGEQTTLGLYFVPGGRVDVRSYAPLCRAVAERGVLVVLQPVPLSLAVLGGDEFGSARDAFPDVLTWGIAGHSLGGAMAAQWFADAASARPDGLALLGAYPPKGVDLTRSEAAFVSVYGTNDSGVAGILAAKSQLPPGTPFVEIRGGNHAQFGDYGPQPGDGEATVGREDQQRQAADAIVAMLRRAQASKAAP